MYALNSTQKQHWTFESRETLATLRAAANQRHVEKYRLVMGGEQEEEGEEEQVHAFLTPDEESLLCRIVAETGARFGDEFRPPMWPSVRWTAFAYFKRFYLHQSAMEFFPKNVMMACYYLGAKVDEFNISIDQFVDNLKTGTRESNVDTVMTLEPVLMERLRYHLTVHTPYRPFEGMMIEAKTIGGWATQGLDLECIRAAAMEFLRKTLIGDAMLLYPPSQLALAAMKYGVESTMGQTANLVRDFLLKLTRRNMGADEAGREVDKLLAKLDVIHRSITDDYESGQSAGMDEQKRRLKDKFSTLATLQKGLDAKLKLLPPSQRPRTQDDVPVDSDDEEEWS